MESRSEAAARDPCSLSLSQIYIGPIRGTKAPWLVRSPAESEGRWTY
jgi:hypothetical protein